MENILFLHEPRVKWWLYINTISLFPGICVTCSLNNYAYARALKDIYI
jgi:hypothetical protein